MTWRFQPKDDNCVKCDRPIDITHELHYIAWSAKYRAYKRECRACYEARTKKPRERRKSSDAILNSYGPQPIDKK